jgi:hypothetical protein
MKGDAEGIKLLDMRLINEPLNSWYKDLRNGALSRSTSEKKRDRTKPLLSPFEPNKSSQDHIVRSYKWNNSAKLAISAIDPQFLPVGSSFDILFRSSSSGSRLVRFEMD